ncbi:SRPBCC family protein [Pseudaminobacter soli (ex Li et al. 2025)]|uniref:ATPase n=1 Tax=Pseudaminobacter soli (ex Li et al. 2025) TaxID=1295366 RepID=A0A2P7SDA3_9HYPH|nr:SRPBCC family protein [Mesorhizobium soli]PSJ60335.1 ATPase [Mesorhizobium soli]
MSASTGRTDTASRIIRATPHTIYRALLDPEAIVRWRPPAGMKAQVYAFDAREGGTFRMSFSYADASHEVRGKTSDDADVFEGRFLELVPDQRVVELIEFESDDPAFAGAMTVTTSLRAVDGGTEVTIRCENVPRGIRPEDHAAGMASTLDNLANFTE